MVENLMKPSIIAVVVAYNDYESLTKTIESIYEQVASVIVIDNSDREMLCEIYPKPIVYLKNETNIGLAKALNQGIQKALGLKCDWVLLLDQDSLARVNMIEKMLASLESYPYEKIAQIAPLIYNHSSKNYFPSYSYHGLRIQKIFKPSQDSWIDFHITSGTLISKEAFEKVGLMDEDFFIDYIDYDYCFRIKEKGYKTLLCSDTLLEHTLGTQNRKIGINFIEHAPWRIYYQNRNRIIVMRRYGSMVRAFVMAESLRILLKFAKILLLETDKNKKIKYFVKGLYHGIKR
jgi:rhamnosyltransferase